MTKIDIKNEIEKGNFILDDLKAGDIFTIEDGDNLFMKMDCNKGVASLLSGWLYSLEGFKHKKIKEVFKNVEIILKE